MTLPFSVPLRTLVGCRKMYAPTVMIPRKMASGDSKGESGGKSRSHITGPLSPLAVWGVRGPYGGSPAALWILSGRTESILFPAAPFAAKSRFRFRVPSRRPSGLRKTTPTANSLAHRTTWLGSDLPYGRPPAALWILSGRTESILFPAASFAAKSRFRFRTKNITSYP